MRVLLSPSKTLDETSEIPNVKLTQPALLDGTQQLATVMKGYKAADLQKLMKISEKLGQLNHDRYQSFQTPFNEGNARPALFTFKGDVYDNMDVANYSADDLAFAQESICILSGFYGLLRPLDLMQPYRLEMGTKVENNGGKNLYQFWGERITEQVNQGVGPVVNLASNEYFKAVKPAALNGKLLTIHFKEDKGDALKVVGLMAKRARGAMADFIIKNRVENVEKLKEFTGNGYVFQPKFSDDNDWVFVANRK